VVSVPAADFGLPTRGVVTWHWQVYWFLSQLFIDEQMYESTCTLQVQLHVCMQGASECRASAIACESISESISARTVANVLWLNA
jgi:hypothetical protein